MRVIPKMPLEYRGVELTKTDYVVNTPRKWTKEEMEWCMKLKEEGCTTKEIAESVDRQLTSVSIKMKRLSKKNDDYNKGHIIDKYNTNKEYFDYLQPNSILDVYCGVKSYWKNNYDVKVISNDMNKEISADYNMDSLKLLCLMYMENKKFDLIDLDPFGSAFDCFDLAIKMAKKGLIVTIGEIGHKRFKRLDYVSRVYGINKFEDFTSDNIIKEIQKIGLQNKKILKVHSKKDWNGISRVWFTIEDLKVIDKLKS